MEGFEPQSGDLCAGLSCADGFWYRVMVLDGRIDDKVSKLCSNLQFVVSGFGYVCAVYSFLYNVTVEGAVC